MANPRDDAYLTVDGGRLEYAWFGPGPDSAPSLVFLHEGLGCVGMWRDFPARMSEATSCGALVFSRTEFGGSDPSTSPRPAAYLLHEAQQVLPRVLDAAGVREAVLIGHSDGATIAALAAAASKGPRLRGVALMAPHVFIEEVTLEGIRAAKAAFEAGPLRQRLARHHGEKVGAVFYGWCDAWLDPASWDWNVESHLPGIEVPVLLIQGEEDQYGTRAQVDAIARQVSGPVECRMLPGCGHVPHREDPETTQALLADFALGCLERPPG